MVRRLLDTGRAGRCAVAERIRTVAAELDAWQQEWCTVDQQVGFHVAVRDRELDTARLAATLRTCGHLGPLRTMSVQRADLDTPHDVARLFAQSVSSDDTSYS